MGIVFALLVILICRQSMSDAAFTDWGWRIPFLISTILVLLSGYIRLKLEESPLFARLKEQGGSQVTLPPQAFFSGGKNWRLILIALFGATAPEGVVWYTGQFYALFYMITVLKIPLVTVYIVLMVALTVGSIFFIFFGWLFDHIGRRNIMTLGFALAVMTYCPVFTWLGTFKDNPVMLTVLVFYLVILVTMVYGPMPPFWRHRSCPTSLSLKGEPGPSIGRSCPDQCEHPLGDGLIKDIVVERVQKLLPMRPALEEIQDLLLDRTGELQIGNVATEGHS
jgi:MFS family permease